MPCVLCGSDGNYFCQGCMEKLPAFGYDNLYPGDNFVDRFNWLFEGAGAPETLDDYDKILEILGVPILPTEQVPVLTIGDIKLVNASLEKLKRELVETGKIQNTDFPLRLATLYCIHEKKGGPAIAVARIVLNIEAENINAHLGAGFGSVLDGNIKSASDYFDAVLSKQPQSAEAWYGKALIMKAGGRWGAAIQFLNEAIKIHPEFYLAYVEKASILYNQRRFEEADKVVDTAIRIQPDSGSAWALKAEILNATGKWGGAYQCLNQAISLEPLNRSYLV
ncbi:MAG: tetratricopeptide repeat protein, partial [Thermoplasmata archaeon]